MPRRATRPPADELHRRRLGAQWLSEPVGRDPVGITRQLLAVQAQDPRGARLAVRSRSTGLTAADVDRALTDDRSLLITWLNRGTLHLVCAEDYPWLHALTTPQLRTGVARRLQQEGVSPAQAEMAVGVIRRALADGPLTRPALRDRLDAAGVPTQGQALVHLLATACLEGLIVRGPMQGREHAYVLVDEWLPAPRPLDLGVALAELAVRYLVAHGPADARDLARWAGITLGAARRGLTAIADRLVERPDGLVDLSSRAGEPVPDLPPPRLLGAYEPVLLGWVSRAAVVGAHQQLVTVNGLFRPFLLVGGRAVGTWRMPGGEVLLEPLEPLTAGQRRALEKESADVVRFLGSAHPG